MEEDFSDSRVESLITCDKLNRSKHGANYFSKLQPWFLDTLVLKSPSM